MKANSIKILAQTAGKTLSKNSPMILTGLSVAGLVSTAIMAGRATLKASAIIEQEEYDKFEYNASDTKDNKSPLTKKEIIKATWKCYIPAGIMGGATIACIIGANSINLRRNAALASAYSLTETALKEYQSKVVETIGKNKERAIKDEIAKDRVERNPVSKNDVIITGRGETLCYDDLSGRYFKSDADKIIAALNSLSRQLMTDMFISLNDVYYELGLERTKLGDMVGWYIDQVGSDLIRPRFSSQLADDGRPCLVLNFEIEPRACDRDY